MVGIICPPVEIGLTDLPKMRGGGCDSPGLSLGPVEVGGTRGTCPPTSHFTHVENKSEIDPPPPPIIRPSAVPVAIFPLSPSFPTVPSVTITLNLKN